MSSGYRIHLHDITVIPLVPPDDTWPDEGRLIASVLADDRLFTQSEPSVKSLDGSWKMAVGLDVTSYCSCITIRVDDFPSLPPSESAPRFGPVKVHPNDIVNSASDQRYTLSVTSQLFQFRAEFTLHEFIFLDEDAIRSKLDDGHIISATELTVIYNSVQHLQRSKPRRSHFLHLVGHISEDRYQESQSLHDLHKSTYLYEEASRDASPNDTGLFIYIASHGHMLLLRVIRLAHLSDLRRSIERLQEAMSLTPEGHPSMRSHFNDLGICLHIRFERLGDLEDLNQSILRLQDALRLTLEDDRKILPALNNLMNALLMRFERVGDLEDLNQVILRLQDIVRLASGGNPALPMWLNSLGSSLRERFDRLGDLEDINESVLRHQDAVRMTPEGHPELPSRLNGLGLSLRSRFDRVGNLDDLNQSILKLHDAVRLTPEGHPKMLFLLRALGLSLRHRFNRLGDLEDLNQAILRQQDAVRFAPDGFPDLSSLLSDLGVSLRIRFEQASDQEDLNQSISRFQDAVRLASDGHPARPSTLNGLGISLRVRFEREGNLEDLNQSVLMLQEAVSLTPESHPAMPSELTNLGNSLLGRFTRLGNLEDLAQSIFRLQDAIRLTPDPEDNPNIPARLLNLGNALEMRFHRLGDLEDLNQSILRMQDAVRLTPEGDVDLPSRLNGLGDSLRTRFERVGNLEDLDRSILRQQDAIRLTPEGHIMMPSRLSDLGASLQQRFNRLGRLEDLNETILRKQDAVRSTPRGHPRLPYFLNTLAISLRSRFLTGGDLEDLNQAILYLQDAVRLILEGAGMPYYLLNTLGVLLVARFEALGNSDDLDQAIATLQDAIRQIPDDHHEMPYLLSNLGDSLASRHQIEHGDLRQAVSAYSTVACSNHGVASVRFRAAHRWAKCLRILECSWQDILGAFHVAIPLLPEIAWMGSSMADRHHQLRGADRVVHEAVAAAIQCGNLALAVEWAEQGRSVIWGQLLQLRTPVDLLTDQHPELGRKIHNSFQLEKVTTRIRGDGLDPLISSHQLVLERTKVLAEIREQPGFERFLRPKPLEELTPAASVGPIVILNPSEWDMNYDVIILHLGLPNHIIHFKLGSFSPHRAKFLHDQLMIVLTTGGRTILAPEGQNDAGPFAQSSDFTDGHVDEMIRELLNGGHKDGRDGELLMHPRKGPISLGYKEILAELWNLVVKPVLSALAISCPQSATQRSRLWWCPAGVLSFLPLHAAGLYSDKGRSLSDGNKLSDFVVSSYTPTLSALLPQQPPSSMPIIGSKIKLLAVAQPSSSGHAIIMGTEKEIQHIQTELETSISIEALVGVEASYDNVIKGLQDSNWVHFACHGVQDSVNPTNSALLLAGEERLTLSKLVELNCANGDLAFLSACQSAKGDSKLSDESVHLGAGMLVAGYKGVIATMWSIRDRDAPLVAQGVYRHLKEEGLKSTEAARALQLAVDSLREEHKAPFISWVPFIHIGR